jgi:p24 family protein delta-1
MGTVIRLFGYVLFLIAIPLVSALKFDISAHHGHESSKYERCIRNFVAKDQLVVVTAIVDGYRGDGQQLNMQVGPASQCLARDVPSAHANQHPPNRSKTQ